MELRQLEYLVAVAEEASFTRAAERVHISQSGVSAQIRQLEHDLGAVLIDRSARAATLTEAGKVAVKYARETLASAAAVRQAVNEVTGLLSGRLTVGMVTACTITALFDALAAFHRAHPGVAITLLEDNSAALAEHTRSGALDVALIGAAGGAPPDLASRPVVSERLVAAVPPDHQLSERTRLTLAGLSGFPLICMPQGTGIRTVFDDSCSSANLRLEVTLEATAPDAVANLAARGLGVAILSETIAAAHAARLHAAVIADAGIPALLTLIWKPSPTPAATEFLAHCSRAFGAAAPGVSG